MPRKAVRRRASPTQSARVRAAIAEEEAVAEATKAQASAALAESRECRAAVDQLREAREKLGLSLTDVAASSGLTRSAVSKLENHHTVNPTLATLLRYAAALDMRLEIRAVRSPKTRPS
jgi:DNA-binding XRE family transcriptional regulator